MHIKNLKELGDFSTIEESYNKIGYGRYFNKIDIKDKYVIKKSIDQNYRDIAFLLSIMHQHNQENSIVKLDNIISTNEHFAMLAKELKAYILYDDVKIKGAQNILEEILNSPNISQRSNERISNILKTFEKR